MLLMFFFVVVFVVVVFWYGWVYIMVVLYLDARATVLLRWCAVLLQWSLWSLCEASSCGLYPLASKWNLYSFWSILVGFLMLSLEKYVTSRQWQYLGSLQDSGNQFMSGITAGCVYWWAEFLDIWFGIVHAGQTYYNIMLYIVVIYIFGSHWMML